MVKVLMPAVLWKDRDRRIPGSSSGQAQLGGGGTQTQGRVKIDGHPRLLSDFCILVPHAPMYVHMTAEHRRLMFASP